MLVMRTVEEKGWGWYAAYGTPLARPAPYLPNPESPDVNDSTTDSLTGPRPQPDRPGDFLMVGIGASAGGIEALRAFFAEVAADSGIAYVVILHLSPDHESHLAHVLQQISRIPVVQVTEKVKVQPDHVYVVPPDQHLTIANEHIHVAQNTTVQDRRAPSTSFPALGRIASLARAVCVVLSGTGADGSMGSSA